MTEDRGPIPTDEMVQAYSGSARAEQYVALGDSLLAFLVQHAGLEPHHHVLDVGCGVGLAARPLARFLTAEGSSDGFDVMREPVEWCAAHYRAFPNFRFQHADVYNKYYNPAGRVAARQYAFPYPSDRFDLVVLTSVFTHLLPRDLRNYLGEVARVIKPGARNFITYSLLNAESTPRLDQWLIEHPGEQDRATLGGLGFRWRYDVSCRVYDREMPETAVAYEESWIRALYEEHALAVEKVQYGEWCRGSYQLGWQDTILSVKVKS